MSDRKNSQGFSTRAIHAGQKPDPTTGAVMTPIYATSTYAQESPGVNKGDEYARGKNPTREAFEASERHSLGEQLHYESERQRELIDRPSFREGVSAFLQKRAPVFGSR